MGRDGDWNGNDQVGLRAMHFSDKEVLPCPIEANMRNESDLLWDSYITLKFCLLAGVES